MGCQSAATCLAPSTSEGRLPSKRRDDNYMFLTDSCVAGSAARWATFALLIIIDVLIRIIIMLIIMIKITITITIMTTITIIIITIITLPKHPT